MLLFIVSCKQDENTEFSYCPEILDSKEPQEATEHIITTDIEFLSPSHIVSVNDTILAVLDLFENGTFIHLVTVNGKHLCSFGKKGKGNGECITPTSICTDKEGTSIYIYDYAMNRSLAYNIHDLLMGNDTPSTINYNNESLEIARYTDVSNSSNNDYIAFGYNDKCRLVLVSDNKPCSIYSNYPKLDDDVEINWSLWNNSAQYTVSPNKKHVVIGTGLGMLFEIFTLEDNEIKSCAIRGFYKPTYEIAQGAKPKCANFAEDTFNGFVAMASDNDAFYGCIGGWAPDYNFNNIIYKFDYKGELIKKTKLKSQVACMTVNKNKDIYFIAEDASGKCHLSMIRQ